MATDKKGVMVYLPADVEQWLEEYCTENSITRKGKDGEPVTSMGTGIIHYLKKHLLGIAPVTPKIEGAEEMTHDDVLDLVRESIAPLVDELAGLRSEFWHFKTRNSSNLDAVEGLARIDHRLAELERVLWSHQHRSADSPSKPRTPISNY
jgi:hypothetical protein